MMDGKACRIDGMRQAQLLGTREGQRKVFQWVSSQPRTPESAECEP